MGWNPWKVIEDIYEDVTEEISRTYKRVEREVKREYKDVESEARRADDRLSESLGFGAPSAQRGDIRHEERVIEARTAQAITQGPEATGPDFIRDFPSAIRKRKLRLAAASVMTRDWLPPTLGTPGLLGIG